MAYQALYRQWRPEDFTQVVGQTGIVTTLRNQVEMGRIAHAYLLCGSRGTGKTSIAKIMSRAINCLEPDHGNPCGHCANCAALLQGDSLDVMEIDAASETGVDSIRELRDSVQYPPQQCKYKVYIIDEVHMLSTSAANALLKTLEEPPGYVVFILATTEPQRLLPTVLSRCQRFDFSRLSVELIVERLRAVVDSLEKKASDGGLRRIALAAEGGMRDAISLLDMCLSYGREVSESLVQDVLGSSDRGFQFAFADSICQRDPGKLMAQVSAFMAEGRDPAVFAKDMAQHMRALLMVKLSPQGADQLLDLTPEDLRGYVAQAERFSQDRLLRAMEQFMGVESEMRWASSPRFALETAAIRCCLTPEGNDMSAWQERVDELEKTVAQLKEQLSSAMACGIPAAGSKAPSDSQMDAGERKSPPAQKKKPAKSAADGRKTAGEGAGVDERSASIWKNTRQILARSNPAVNAYLLNGDLVGAENGTYLWKSHSGFEVFNEMIMGEENLSIVQTALTEAAGEESRFQAVTGDQQAEKKATVEEDLLSFQQSFGAENVTVQEAPVQREEGIY